MPAAPPTRPALRERYDRRRREVVDRSATVLARSGYHGTSIGDLAAATGLAAGGLYHYIGSKEELLVLVCEQLMEPLQQQAEVLLGEPGGPEEHLRRLVRLWVQHVAAHRDHMRVFEQERHVIAAEPRWAEVRESRKRFERLLDHVLREGERTGAFTFADRDLALRALLGMVNHTAHWFRPDGRLSAEAVADGYCDVLLGTA